MSTKQEPDAIRATSTAISIKQCHPSNDVLPSQDERLPTQIHTPPLPSGPNHHAERSLEAYQFFIVNMITISIFGASTFTVIAGEMTDPASIWDPEPPPFTLATVRRFLAAAWLCFSLTIGISGYSSSVLVSMRHRAERQLDTTWHRRWETLGLFTSAILHLLIVTAFLLLSLSLVAYVGTLGWFIVACACAALIFAVGLILTQYRWVAMSFMGGMNANLGAKGQSARNAMNRVLARHVAGRHLGSRSQVFKWA